MHVRMGLSIGSLFGAVAILLSGCTLIQPQAGASVPEVQAASVAEVTSGEAVAVLVVDYFDKVQPDDTPETAGNCVTDVTEQVYWITWVVDEPINTSAAHRPPETISHGDLVYTEVAGQTGSDREFTPQENVPASTESLVFLQDANKLIVSRVAISDHTTSAVAEGIDAAVEHFRAVGVDKFVINLSFVLLPCVPTAATLELSAKERVDVGIAAINSLPLIEASGEVLPSPYARYLNDSLQSTLSSLNIPILECPTCAPVFPAPGIPPAGTEVPDSANLSGSDEATTLQPSTPGVFAIDAGGNAFSLPATISPLPATVMGSSFDIIESFQADDVPFGQSAVIDLAGGVPGLSYPSDMNLDSPDSALSSPPVYLPTMLASDIPPAVLNRSLETLAPIFAQSLLSWTIPSTLPEEIQAISLTTEIDTSPTLVGLRLSEEYMERDRLCMNLEQGTEVSEALSAYCRMEEYATEINDPESQLVLNDPLYRLLTDLHSEEGVEVITVAAAGNLGMPYPFAPASWPNVISVGAMENPFFVANSAEVVLPGLRTLSRIIRANDEQITLTSTITVGGTSFAAPQLSFLAAKYLLEGSPYECVGDTGQTSPPLNYGEWSGDIAPHGTWNNLTLIDAVKQYCKGFPAQ